MSELNEIQQQIAEVNAPVANAQTAYPIQLTGESTPQPPVNDYYELYKAERAEADKLRALIAAAKITPTQAHPDANVKVKSFEETRAQVGAARWHMMNNGERLLAMGQNPEQDLGYVKQLWGRGADLRLSADLNKANPRKYRETKQAALALNLFNR